MKKNTRSDIGSKNFNAKVQYTFKVKALDFIDLKKNNYTCKNLIY